MKAFDLETLELMSGSHAERERGVCIMEAVAWFANEPHSDHPECACPVLTNFGIGLNDNFTHEYRQKLKPLIPKLVGTRNPELEAARSSFLCDGVLRRILPASIRRFADRVQSAGDLELAESFRNHARQFEELPEIKISDRALALDLARALDLPVSDADKYRVWDAAIELFDQAIAISALEEVKAEAVTE